MTTRPPLLQKPDCLVELPSIQPPMPPAFPTFSELVEEEAKKTPTMRKKLTDLFDGTLGDLTPLVSDYQRNPEKYGAEAQELLEQLMHGCKSLERLNQSERLALNIATMDYHQPSRPKPAPAKMAKRSATRSKKPRKAKKRAEPRPGLDVPVTELPAYWWLR